MKFVPENRPVSIHSVRYAPRWFPHLMRHTDGSLLMYINWSYDAHFSPAMMMRSIDNGKTWSEPVDTVPRRVWSHSFSDGELLDMDEVGVQDPNSPETAVCFDNGGDNLYCNADGVIENIHRFDVNNDGYVDSGVTL